MWWKTVKCAALNSSCCPSNPHGKVGSEDRRIAMIWKRGGLFWKSEKCANDLDSNFHWSWINFRRFARNLRRNVSESSEIQRFFPPKIRWSPKKKKKVFAKIRSDFLAKSEIQSFFPPKISWSPKKKKKKKKRSSPKFGVIFRPKSEIQRFFPPKIRWSPKKKKGLRQNWGCYFVQFRKFRRLRGAVFEWGGYFSHKIDLKSTKSMRFCILYKPMGGARAAPPPPPGYATEWRKKKGRKKEKNPICSFCKILFCFINAWLHLSSNYTAMSWSRKKLKFFLQFFCITILQEIFQNQIIFNNMPKQLVFRLISRLVAC